MERRMELLFLQMEVRKDDDDRVKLVTFIMYVHTLQLQQRTH